MALNAGNTACTTGLSARIYNAWTGAAGNGFSGTLTTAQTDAVKALCYAIAAGVVAEIQGNGTTATNAPADAFGAGIPPSQVILSGSIT